MRLAPQRLDHFCRSDHLAYVPLRVIGHMNQRPANESRQMLPPHEARRIEISRGQHPNALCCKVERKPNDNEQLIETPVAEVFGLESGKLTIRELVSLCVSENAIGGARHVPQMKGDGRESERLRVYFSISQAGSPLCQVVESQLKRMQNSAARRRNVAVSAAQPGFGIRGGGSTHLRSVKPPIGAREPTVEAAVIPIKITLDIQE